MGGFLLHCREVVDQNRAECPQDDSFLAESLIDTPPGLEDLVVSRKGAGASCDPARTVGQGLPSFRRLIRAPFVPWVHGVAFRSRPR